MLSNNEDILLAGRPQTAAIIAISRHAFQIIYAEHFILLATLTS